MNVLTVSQNSCFHQYIGQLFSGEKNATLKHATYEGGIEAAIEQNPCCIVLDVHANGKMQECNGLNLLKKLRDSDLSFPVLMLSWFSRKHVLQHTHHNTSNNQWLFIRYQSCYKFCQLPLSSENLFDSVKTLKPFDHE